MSTPILLLIFNRPSTTALVFKSVKKAKPKKLYISQDGPRNEKDRILIDEVRKLLIIDRECEVFYNNKDENLGCRDAVVGGINWFFEHEDFGIILEDDCVMSPEFMGFCDRCNELYKEDKIIGSISGSNYIPKTRKASGDYFFSSQFPLLRGWATRKDRRRNYRHKVQLERLDYPSYTKWYCSGGYRDSNRYTTSLNNDRLTVVPEVNLVTNIGYIGIHSQRAGRFHNLSLGRFTNKINGFAKKEFKINMLYDSYIKRFILKLYIYTKLERLLKKIGLYKPIHTLFLAFIKQLNSIGLK